MITNRKKCVSITRPGVSMASDSKKADTSTDPPCIIDVDEEREEEEEEQPKKKYTSLFIYTCITLNPQEKLIYFQLDFWCP